MYKFIIYLLISLTILPASADFVTYSNVNPYYNNYNNRYNINSPNRQIVKNYNKLLQRNRNLNNHYYNNSYLLKKNLSALERHALDKTFQRDNELKRLERLENLAFGSIQSGDLYSRYNNLESAILSRPKYRQNSILNNIASYFVGQATGFTPNLYPYSNINTLGGFNDFDSSGFTNNRYEQYSNGLFGGHGWSYSGVGTGNGSSVRILND